MLFGEKHPQLVTLPGDTHEISDIPTAGRKHFLIIFCGSQAHITPDDVSVIYRCRL
jgi:hypothetical protein